MVSALDEPECAIARAGLKTRQRFQDDVDQLQIDHLIVGDGSWRLGIGYGARRKDEPHRLAHAVIEMQVRAEAADQGIEHAGLDHRGPQVHRAFRLRIAVGEIEARCAVLDRDPHRELDGLVHDDAIAVEETFGRCFPGGQPRDRGAQLVGGALENGRENARSRSRRRSARTAP